jgi:hypothetical protein
MINVWSNIVSWVLGSIWWTALQIQSAIIAWATQIYVKALSTNTGILYIWNSWVTSWAWFELIASEWQFIEINDPSKLYVISNSTAQSLSYFIVY